MFAVSFDNGPGLVGPFGSKDAGQQWAQRYADEYAAATPGQSAPLSWTVVPLTEPETLEWW